MTDTRGFTLPELILFITMASIMGTMLTVFSHNSTRQSVDPVRIIDNKNILQEEMEDITKEYKREIAAGTLELHNFKANHVDGRSLVVASETQFLTLITGDRPVLLVTLALNNEAGYQKIWALFTD